MGSGKSIQQQKHEYYIQEGKYVHQNISGVRLSDAKQDVSSKKVRQIQPVVQKQKHEVEPTKHRNNGLVEIVEEQEESYQRKASELGEKAVIIECHYDSILGCNSTKRQGKYSV